MCRLPMFLQWMEPHTFIYRQQCILDYIKKGGAQQQRTRNLEGHTEKSCWWAYDLKKLYAYMK